jgi:hypothetical protein
VNTGVPEGLPDWVTEETAADPDNATAANMIPPKPKVLDLNPAAIPEEFTTQKTFVGWRPEWDSKRKAWTKVPIDLHTGGYAKSDDPATWVDWTTALDRYRGFGCDGIGICRTDDLIFIDLDGVLNDDGSLKAFPWISKILVVIQGRCYMERSALGNGLHAIGRGRLPAGRRQFDEPRLKHTGFAFYDASRYFTLTGHVYPGSGAIVDLTTELVTLHADLFPPKVAKARPAVIDASSDGHTARASASSPTRELNTSFTVLLSDDELLARARRAANGHRFSGLFDRGEWQDRYPSESEADMALLCMLAFWAEGDPGRMERLFTRSALADKKWERADYRARSIGRALDVVTERYDPRRGRRRALAAESLSTSASGSLASSSSASSSSRSPASSTPGSPPPPAEPPGPRLVPPGGGGLQNGKPLIALDPPEYERIVAEVLEALYQAHDFDPQLFLRGGLLTEVIRDEKGSFSTRVVTQQSMILLIDQAATFYRQTTKGPTLKPVPSELPSLMMARLGQLLRDDPASVRLPSLTGITECPLIREDHSILVRAEHGYDRETGYYYAADPCFAQLHVPLDPTSDDLDGAIGLMHELLDDFPFAEPAATFFATFVAVLLLLFLRLLINDLLPAILIDSTTPGSGKGLLAQIINILATGRRFSPNTVPQAPEAGEWRKALLSLLLSGKNLVVFDNIVGEGLNSPELCALLTGGSLDGRLLGTNTHVHADAGWGLWVLTGNHLHPTDEVARRSIWIRLEPPTARPDLRTDFKHDPADDPLEEWTLSHRVDLVRALLILYRWWVKSGCPAANPKRPLGNFRKAANLVCAITDQAGIPDAINFDIRRVYLDDRSIQIIDFLEVVDRVTYGEEFTCSHVAAVSKEKTWNKEANNGKGALEFSANAQLLRDALPTELARVVDRPELTQQMGTFFRGIKGKHFGEQDIAVINILLPNGRPKKSADGKTLWAITKKE